MAERWWSVRWTRVGLGIVIALGGLWLLTIPAAHVMVWYEARDLAKNEPRAALQLQALGDTRVADLKDGLTVNRFGYSFRVPWTKTKVERDFKTVVSMGFGDGSSLLVFDPRDRIDLLGSATVVDETRREGLRSMLGEEAVNSHYGFTRVEMNTSSNEIGFLHSRRSNARAMMLLGMKSLEIPEHADALYTVSAPHLRGFQFGSTQRAPTFVELLLFDDHDRGLELIIKGPRGSVQPVLTQEQINGIVASIKVPR